MEKFDREEMNESFAIEKGDAVQREYRTQDQGPKILKPIRYQSKKNIFRLHKRSNKQIKS